MKLNAILGLEHEQNRKRALIYDIKTSVHAFGACFDIIKTLLSITLQHGTNDD